MSIFGTIADANGGERFEASITSGEFSTALGDLIAIFVGFSDSGTVAEFTDVAGNDYTPQALFHNLNGGQFGQWYVCLSATKASATNTATATFSGGAQNNSIIWVYDTPISGGTPELDGAVAQGAGSTGDFNTTGLDEIVFCVGYNQTGGNFTVDTDFTLDSDNFGTFGGAEHATFSSAQNGLDLSFDGSSNGITVAAIAFKAAPPAPPSKRRSRRSK